MFLAGERSLAPDRYYTGTDPGDNEAMYVGCDNDNSRSTFNLPNQDTVGQYLPTDFGSAHSGGLNMLFCDGSVRFFEYDIPISVWKPLGNRN